MVSIVLASKRPAPEPVIIGPEWLKLTLMWEGYDGSSWDLTSRAGGVYLMPGVRGLGAPRPQRYSRTSPALSGSRYRGNVIQERDVYWPIHVESPDGSLAFEELDSGFWATMNPNYTGTWTARSPSGGERRLQCRFTAVEDGQDSDPLQAGWANYGISLVAEQPFWEGTPLTDDWGVSEPVDFYPVGSETDVVDISSGSSVTTATFTNPGDVEAYPIWRITGPTAAVTIGVGGKNIPVPFAIPDGQELVVDTNPSELTAYLNGVDKTGLLGSADFSPVPPGVNVPLSITMDGTGRVYMSLTPRYFRAY